MPINAHHGTAAIIGGTAHRTEPPASAPRRVVAGGTSRHAHTDGSPSRPASGNAATAGRRKPPTTRR
ncbi:hypothetical protein, partial [Mangrovactinospora gilvigrisea]|uniref:hypothetical protein n=1 Tax=Mangrovactinospora gilvigrisea TaxID=1428644 RepID=UPI001C313C0A